MKHTLVLAMVLCGIGIAGSLTDGKTFPIRLIIAAKHGAVSYNHFRHAEREGFECKTCHSDRQWPMDTRAALQFKEGGHQTKEENKSSCGACHHPGGKAFATAGNCSTRCHNKYAGGVGPSE